MAQMLQDVIVWHAFGVQLRYFSKGDQKDGKDNIILFRVQPALKKNTLAPWLTLLPSFAYG